MFLFQEICCSAMCSCGWQDADRQSPQSLFGSGVWFKSHASNQTKPSQTQTKPSPFYDTQILNLLKNSKPLWELLFLIQVVQKPCLEPNQAKSDADQAKPPLRHTNSKSSWELLFLIQVVQKPCLEPNQALSSEPFLFSVNDPPPSQGYVGLWE